MWKQKKPTFLASAALISLVAAGSLLLAMSVQAISRGYLSDDDGLKPGMVVKLSDNGTAETPRVVRATSDEAEKIIGLATTVADSNVTIASEGQTVFIETSGELTAYVTDLNGSLKQGDALTISPLNGVLERATDRSSFLMGTALEPFPSEGVESYQIQTNDGGKTANIARIRINLDQKTRAGSGQADSSLERLGHSVVGREVSEVRLIVALIIFFIVLIAEGAILYGAISSAVLSVGRNPLAGETIRKQLIQVMFLAICVLSIGLAAIYLVVWV